MQTVFTNFITFFLQYFAFAIIIFTFFYDFTKCKKRTYILGTLSCILYASVITCLCQNFFGEFSPIGIFISVANTLAAAITAIHFLVAVPKSQMLYAFSVTLEYACFAVGHLAWWPFTFTPDYHNTPLFLTELLILSTVICFATRRYISPLYGKWSNNRTWLLLSITPILGAMGYYVLTNITKTSFSNYTLSTLIGHWFLFAALISANIICAACVYHSIAETSYFEKYNATTKLLKLQKEEYSRMASLLSETSEVRHNFHHQASTMALLLQEGKIEELKDFLAEFTQELPSRGVSTGNAVVDAVFGHYLSLAQKEQINIDYQLDLPTGNALEDTDFTVLIGNCLENAIEASRKLPVEKRKIRVRSRLRGDFLMFVFENNYDGKISSDGTHFYSSKRDPFEEGIGLASIKRIAEQYGGEMKIEYTDTQFFVKLSLRNME